MKVEKDEYINCAKMHSAARLCLDPLEGEGRAYSALNFSNPLAGFNGSTSKKRRKGREGKGTRRKGTRGGIKGKVKEGRRWKGRECNFCPSRF